MKIVALDSKNSLPDSLVFIIEPPLPQEVFEVFQQNLPNQPNFPGIPITYERGNIRVHATILPQGFTEYLERLFKESIGLIAHVKQIEEEKKQIAASQKQEALEAAAKRTGLPIR